MEIPTTFLEKANFVKVIFTDVEKEYDVLLHLMTLGLDWTWRRRMLSRVRYSSTSCVLDLACGTGLVTFELSRHMSGDGLVVGLDPSKSMLRPAIRKKHMARGCSLEFVRATGEFMPFRDRSFQYITVGLALRNFGDKVAVFKESFRALTCSGWFISVDFVLPQNLLIRRLYLFHIFHVLPALGRLVSANWQRTLAYLARSIELSSPPVETQRMLSEHAFVETFHDEMTLGVVTVVGGRR